MVPATQPERPHRDHGLFSDHYLNVTLPERPDWQALAGKASVAMKEVARILAAYTPSTNEAQVVEELVRPVLRLLGHDSMLNKLLQYPGTRRWSFGV